MIVAVASGKGGTGKTLVATSLAIAMAEKSNVQLLDCDVEEPNAHIFLRPQLSHSEAVETPTPVIDEQKCVHCGLCADACVFNALAVLTDRVLVFPELCHGCGACSALCPTRAITETGRSIGSVETGWAGEIAFGRGVLKVGEATATPIIRRLKSKLMNDRLVIIDVSPGASCPVVEAVRGSDFCLLVTEPTPFGLHDLEIAVRLLEQLAVPSAVVLNRSSAGASSMEAFCAQRNLPLLLRIPLSMDIARQYSMGVTLAEHSLAWRQDFQALGDRIAELATALPAVVGRDR